MRPHQLIQIGVVVLVLMAISAKLLLSVEAEAPELPQEASAEQPRRPSAPTLDSGDQLATEPSTDPSERPIYAGRGTKLPVPGVDIPVSHDELRAATPKVLDHPAVHPSDVDADDVRVAVDLILPRVQTCVSPWFEADPKASGPVVMEYRLGPRGLGDVWILERTDVPAEVLRCLALAIREPQWPMVTAEVAVRYPFVFAVSSAPVELPEGLLVGGDDEDADTAGDTG